jgi:septal ring factor EnvC (AmiA/AmiB activator)
MEGIDRLIEIMAEMLDEQKGMRGEMNAMRKEQEQTNQRLENLEKQMVKNNLGIGELRVSVMRLADEIEKIVLLDQRVSKLEDAVFRKSA